jgi:hypothetical protein
MAARMLLLIATMLFQESRSPFTGDGVQGGGHACDSSLRVYAHTLNYDTSFTNCPKTPYTVIEQAGNHYVYRLRSTAKSCPVQVLTIDKFDDMPDTWQIAGYGSEAAWRRRDENDRILCPMY